MLEIDLRELQPSQLSNADLRATYALLRRAIKDTARAWRKFQTASRERPLNDRRLERAMRLFNEASTSISAVGGPATVRRAMRRLAAEMAKRI